VQGSISLSGPNVAAVLLRKDELVMKEIDMPPAPGAGQVIVKMRNVGICGSDVHYWTHGNIGDFVVKAPMIIGHESSGVVYAVGVGVKHLEVGDRVALEPGVPCGKCEHCKTGRYNLCADIKFFATPPVDGSLAKYMLHSADFCYKLPDNVSLEEGAMCEPLSVGVYACRRANVQPGSRLLVLGCGPIGIVCMLVARAFGATHVYMTDVSEDRMGAALRLGATAVFNAKKSDEELVREIQATNGGLVDASIECCGIESATRAALCCTKSGGTVCLVGLNQPEMRLPIFQASIREVDVKGIFRYNNTYPTCIALLASRAVNVKPLITHRYASRQLIEGFTHAKTMHDGALKIMFDLNDM
jgi:L-iditol 2-dehydrogenase